jgi:hypothetical protein
LVLLFSPSSITWPLKIDANFTDNTRPNPTKAYIHFDPHCREGDRRREGEVGSGAREMRAVHSVLAVTL